MAAPPRRPKNLDDVAKILRDCARQLRASDPDFDAVNRSLKIVGEMVGRVVMVPVDRIGRGGRSSHDHLYFGLKAAEAKIPDLPLDDEAMAAKCETLAKMYEKLALDFSRLRGEKTD